MPKTPTDYSKAIIYSIICKTDDTLLYIGSTTNFRIRKNQHKSDCSNEKSEKYNLQLCVMIRANGGWDNFDMKPVKEYPCDNKIQLEIEEERIRKEMNAKFKAHITIEEVKEPIDYSKAIIEEVKEPIDYSKAIIEEVKEPIDYSKGLIYSIVCKTDETILYIGSTTNFRIRKNQHKSDCSNEKSEKYNLQLYVMIRANGGWDNFDMKPVKQFPYENKTHLVIEEENVRKRMNANLNKIKAHRTIEEHKEYSKKFEKNRQLWRKANKEKIKEYSRKRYDNQKEIKSLSKDLQNVE